MAKNLPVRIEGAIWGLLVGDALGVPYESKPGGSGYVVDSLHSAKWTLTRGAYPAVVRAAVRLGHDTDTTACIAGGLAGLRDGLNAIPERWRKDLREPQLFEQLLGQLVERASVAR